VSGSAISQIEHGRVNPTVATLHRMAMHLGLSVDELLSSPATSAMDPSQREDGAERDGNIPEHDRADAGDPGRRTSVVRRGEGHAIVIDGGATWVRLSAADEGENQFLMTVYDIDGASTAEDKLVQQRGREHGYVVEGSIGVTLGCTTHRLGPGDSISFDAAIPHRVFNCGHTPARMVWYVADGSTV
jgi:quercetin dioxygenase-like cupin family protein